MKAARCPQTDEQSLPAIAYIKRLRNRFQYYVCFIFYSHSTVPSHSSGSFKSTKPIKYTKTKWVRVLFHRYSLTQPWKCWACFEYIPCILFLRCGLSRKHQQPFGITQHQCSNPSWFLLEWLTFEHSDLSYPFVCCKYKCTPAFSGGASSYSLL